MQRIELFTTHNNLTHSSYVWEADFHKRCKAVYKWNRIFWKDWSLKGSAFDKMRVTPQQTDPVFNDIIGTML